MPVASTIQPIPNGQVALCLPILALSVRAGRPIVKNLYPSIASKNRALEAHTRGQASSKNQSQITIIPKREPISSENHSQTRTILTPNYHFSLYRSSDFVKFRYIEPAIF